MWKEALVWQDADDKGTEHRGGEESSEGGQKAHGKVGPSWRKQGCK